MLTKRGGGGAYQQPRPCSSEVFIYFSFTFFLFFKHKPKELRLLAECRREVSGLWKSWKVCKLAFPVLTAKMSHMPVKWFLWLYLVFSTFDILILNTYGEMVVVVQLLWWKPWSATWRQLFVWFIFLFLNKKGGSFGSSLTHYNILTTLHCLIWSKQIVRSWNELYHWCFTLSSDWIVLLSLSMTKIVLVSPYKHLKSH